MNNCENCRKLKENPLQEEEKNVTETKNGNFEQFRLALLLNDESIKRVIADGKLFVERTRFARAYYRSVVLPRFRDSAVT